jgi:hypothetical protein
VVYGPKWTTPQRFFSLQNRIGEYTAGVGLSTQRLKVWL